MRTYPKLFDVISVCHDVINITVPSSRDKATCTLTDLGGIQKATHEKLGQDEGKVGKLIRDEIEGWSPYVGTY